MPSQVSSRIGANLRALRLAHDLTQRQLAERIGTDSFQVSRWERGVNRPQDETLFALATALGVDVAAFYEPEATAA
jgi:transcriptional regulator with XRE-family HTH domain